MGIGDARYRGRFIQIGRMAAETFVQYAPTEERSDLQSVVKKFLAEVYDLMTDWGRASCKWLLAVLELLRQQEKAE